ncbi:helix-turn-helix domain-containing protein [Emticicia sp. TH156]|uniref:helix-turn-helix domain-containing protein n=1 Tax=Emticicia sp. TH156 TaxID=2067454 RepID=UPI000C77C50E|nr:helix-turn-helix domain-containing protein [Emticicia sp. TH156]
MKPIEEALFNYQLEKRLTQHEMAALLNVSQATYNNWVNQKTTVAPKYYPVITKVCGIEVSYQAYGQRRAYSIENKSHENELKLYQKFTQNLEEQIAYLKERAGELQFKLQEKESILRSQQEEINLLRKRLV